MSFFTKTARTAALMLTLITGAASFTHTAVADDPGGTWTKRYQTIKGSWSIVETSEGRFLELDDKFKTRKAPDLKLFLSRNAPADVTPENAVDSSVLISKLRKAKGAQRYELPAELDLDEFSTLVLHCEQYTKLWGVSEL